MADHVIPFDLGVEILRGAQAALAMHGRRTRLALASMPDPYAGREDGDCLLPDDVSRATDQLLGRGDGLDLAREILEGPTSRNFADDRLF
jgi:hypothetical protein